MPDKKSKLIVKDNVLINASYNLDLTEQRLILLAIVEARENNQGINTNDPLTIHAESYASQFNVHRNSAYEALKNACIRLKRREFSYQELTKKGNIHHKITGWVSEVGYVEAEARVTLIFSPAVVPMITALEKQFTSYELEQVSALTSPYSVRLYELLIAWRSTGKTPLFELEKLRYQLGVEPHEYTRMDNLKSRVLDASIKQINEHTDIAVNYKQHKRGRSITGFSFSFKQKNAAKPLSTAKKGRQRITKKEAEEMAYLGEEWPDLLARLTGQYHIIDM